MHVTILGMGLSRDHYIDETLKRGKCSDEVWGINSIGAVVQCDRIFMMDDARRLIQYPNFQWIKSVKVPIMTSTARPEISPMLVEYPIEEIMAKFGSKYFSNTVPYAIAYAVHIGVKKLTFFGCDYDYNGDTHEVNRAGTEFWLGICHALGVHVCVSQQSNLMNMKNQKLYGYEDNHDLHQAP